MVSSLLVDALADPTRVLLELYNEQPGNLDFPAKVTRHFSNIFKAANALNEIPRLNTSYPPQVHSSRSLVRFNAMVQDTSPSPEMYLAVSSHHNSCGGWGISADTPLNMNDIIYTNVKECTVIWAVSVPGLTSWAAEAPAPSSRISYTMPLPHKYPIAGDHIGVQLKIYDQPQSFKSADLLTFVGILTTEPLHSESETPIDVPTLHVLFSTPYVPGLALPLPSVTPESDTLREELITWMSDEALGGDRDAAEWILLTIISKVQSRRPSILPPSLTLTCFPPAVEGSSIPTLTCVLEELLPLCVTLPLSVDTLNKVKFFPESKNEDLHSGHLQMPSGTSILMTEVNLQEGTLVENGLTNLRTVQDIISSQMLTYIFPYSQFSFPTDLPIIILSQGQKSTFFETTVTLPLRVTEPSADLYKPKACLSLPSSGKLSAFRRLILSARAGKVTIGDTVSEYIQEDFVKERQKDNTVTAERLILRMSIARLLALSLHKKEVTTEIWKRMKLLETRSKAHSGLSL